MENILIEFHKKGNYKYDAILKFLKDNKAILEEQDIQTFFLSEIKENQTAAQKLRIIFIEALNAAGGNNLDKSGQAAKKFYELTQEYTDKTVDFEKFCTKLGVSQINYVSLFYKMVENKDLLNFGKKKCALFLKQIHFIQTKKPELQIFTNYPIKNNELFIPVDRVIIFVLNKIYNLQDADELKAEKDFETVNKWAFHVHNEEPILFEELWFWGYFTQKITKENRILEFNEEKYYASKFIYPDKDIEKALTKFIQILNS